jgi:leucyl-tRNA synthetase
MGRGTGDEGRETERIVVSEAIDLFLRILHPFAPHITDELWERLGNEGSLFTQSWAEVDEEALVQETVTIVVQVNGRVRGRIVVPIDATKPPSKHLPCKSLMSAPTWKAKGQVAIFVGFSSAAQSGPMSR